MMSEQEFTELHEKLTQELRRGILVLITLNQLKEPKYGYGLINSLDDRGLHIDQGTLYPLLRRLESQGLLQSEWNVDGSRPRRYYQISQEGTQVLEALIAEWRELTQVIEKLLGSRSLQGGKS